MLNDAILNLGEYASKTIARQVEGKGNIVSLSIGEPVFGPPPNAMAAIQRLMSAERYASDMKRYETSRGMPGLRDRIAAYYRTFWGMPVDPATGILVTHGGAGALTAAILATSRPGDEYVIGDPSYMLYERLLLSLGRRPVPIVRKAEEGYRWDAGRVAGRITDRTAGVIINSPENPTGHVCSDDEMQALVELCERRGVMLIHDEVYDQFCFDRSHRPAGSFAGLEHVVQINSLSKKFGVPGLRMGWLASNARVTAIAAKAQDYTTLAVGTHAERVAEALLDCPELAAWFTGVREGLRRSVALTVARLSAVPGIAFPGSISGGMFAFPTVQRLAERLGLPGEGPAGDAVARWLLEHAGVAVVPGSVYGRAGAGAVRLVLCGPEDHLLEALTRIERAAADPAGP